MTNDLEEARRRRAQRGAKVGAFGPSGRKQDKIDRVMLRVEAAAAKRADYYTGKTPTPERITIALDFAELYGPEVDQALGGEEPMVDEWESGEHVPTLAQVQALAEMTGFLVRWFYEPAPPPLGQGWICGADGCRPLAEQ